MSVTTDFLSDYEPVEVINLPLSSTLYKSDAIDELAGVVSNVCDDVKKISAHLSAISNDVSSILSDYEKKSELSVEVNTNRLSTGVFTLNGYTFGVEQDGNNTVLTIGDGDDKADPVFNLTNGRVPYSRLPRTELDAGTTIFRTPDGSSFYKLCAVVNNHQDGVPPIRLVAVNSPSPEENEESVDAVYLRLPGTPENNAVLSIGVGSTGEVLSGIAADVLGTDVYYAEIANRMFFTDEMIGGDEVESVGLPSKITLESLCDTTKQEWDISLTPDAKYISGVVENKTLNTFKGIWNGLSSVSSLLSDCNVENIRVTVNGILSALSILSSAFQSGGMSEPNIDNP